ncbi:hypothetical protein EMCRGX_G019761 [Ephydatia muelleri]
MNTSENVTDMARISDPMLIGGPELFKKYQCPSCRYLLKGAVQLSCGHWVCQACADRVFQTSSPPRCPRNDCNDELESTEGCKYFPDRFVRKEILGFNVKCVNHAEGCLWIGNVSTLEDHLGKCDYRLLPCPLQCGTKIASKELEDHVISCPNSRRHCPLYGHGCKHEMEMDSEELTSHIRNEGLVQHIIFLASAIKTIQDDYHGDGDRGLAEEQTSMTVSDVGCSRHSSRQNTGERSAVPNGVKPKAVRTAIYGPLFRSASEISKLGDDLKDTFMSEIKQRDVEITQLRAQLSAFEKKVQAKETESEDRGFRLSLLENVNYDGTMMWKIPQFAQRMADAQSGKYTSIFSLPFYTSRYGYKLCLRLYILGDGIGKGTHMSLFFVVMRGEFDNILQWPFTHKVTFRLLNQGAGQDVVDSFLPDPMSSSFKKPKTDMNVASGCPRFVSISDVKTGGFIANDTIFIKVKVEDVPAPSKR